MFRTFRLTNEPGGLGLSCTDAGLSLAGVPLLRKTDVGFVPRRPSDIATLVKAAYGPDPTRLQSSLDVIAQALNRSDLARAMISSVLTRTPELSKMAAARLANADAELTKYDPGEPRDWHGRWTTSGDPPRQAMPVDESAPAQESDPIGSLFSSVGDASDRRTLFIPVASPTADDKADDRAQDPVSLHQALEGEYDDLGPVDFAKLVIQFGDWVERTRGNLSPAERERVLAEYSFLQDRLSFWLSYEFKPAVAHANLISAALTLFQGGTNSGLIRPHELPRSMLYVGSTAWAFDGMPSRIGPSTKVIEEPIYPRVFTLKEIEGLGGIVNNSEVNIVWGKSIRDQGRPWEIYNERVNPGAPGLPPTSKTFDQFNGTTGDAISNKTLNTLTFSSIKDPQTIYYRLKGYIDATADYVPRTKLDLASTNIESKTIHLAIPEFTSPMQWRYLYTAIVYGKGRDVSVVITRIRE